MSSQSVVLHIQIIDHLENDATTSTTLSAQAQTQPRSYHYLEQDGITQVDLIQHDHGFSLIRKGAWHTNIQFSTQGLGTFSVISDQGELRGEVKLISSLINDTQIKLSYQLIMDRSIITHQTLTVTIRGAQA